MGIFEPIVRGIKKVVEPSGGGKSWEDVLAARQAEEEKISDTELLYSTLRDLGYDVPTSQDEAVRLATELVDLQTRLNAPYQAGQGSVDTYLQKKQFIRRQIDTVKSMLGAYAASKWGAGAETIITRILRPTTPDVAKLPTAEEFLSEFSQAYSTHIEALSAGGGLSKEEKAFAYSTLRNEAFNQYTAKLGEIAKTGISPFTLEEVSREERGIGPETAAGKALDAALGPGVTGPTEVTGTGEQVAEQMDKLGVGVPKEFTTRPRVKPLDFLGGSLTAENIKMAYAGSAQGAGAGNRLPTAGFVSTPRRV